MASSFVPKRKLALTIGIDEYTKGHELEKAVRDAKDVGEALYSIGFKVTSKFNCNFQDFKEAIKSFINTIRQNDIVLFYYAGHGKEEEEEKMNYLLPADYFDYSGTRIKEIDSIKERAINAQNILADIHAKQPEAVILVLDCCRIAPSTTRGGDPPQIGMMDKSPKTFVAYACAPGTVAKEKTKSGHNGPYAKYLVPHLKIPDIDFSLLMDKVALGVQSETNKGQIPQYTNDLSRELQLTPKPFSESGFAIPGTYEELPENYFVLVNRPIAVLFRVHMLNEHETNEYVFCKGRSICSPPIVFRNYDRISSLILSERYK